MLSAFFRQKYSWLTVGAIAGSAPVLAKLDFPAYDQTVSDVIMNHDPDCEKIIRDGFQEIRKKKLYKNLKEYLIHALRNVSSEWLILQVMLVV